MAGFDHLFNKYFSILLLTSWRLNKLKIMVKLMIGVKYNKLQVTLNIYSVNTNLFRSFTHSSVNIGQLERYWNLTLNNLNLLN